MKKWLFLLVGLLSTSVLAEGMGSYSKDELKEAKEIAKKQAHKYAEAVHCLDEDDYENTQVFYVSGFKNSKYEDVNEAFFVNNHVSFNCSLGSGVHGEILTLISFLDSPSFLYVVTENVLPEQINTKFIQSLKQKGNKLIIRANDYAPDDHNNYGTLMYEYIFNLQTLKLEKTTYLGRENF